MTHFQKRRAEILGKRKRKPRACDVARQEGRRYQAAMALRRQKYAIRRLELVWHAAAR